MEQLIRLALMALFIPLWFDGRGKKQTNSEQDNFRGHKFHEEAITG